MKPQLCIDLSTLMLTERAILLDTLQELEAAGIYIWCYSGLSAIPTHEALDTLGVRHSLDCIRYIEPSEDVLFINSVDKLDYFEICHALDLRPRSKAWLARYGLPEAEPRQVDPLLARERALRDKRWGLQG